MFLPLLFITLLFWELVEGSNEETNYIPALKEWHNIVSVNSIGEGLKPIDSIAVNYTSGLGPVKLFQTHLKTIAEVFNRNSVSLNYIEIGACDGENDFNLDFYMQDSNINGLFIEPMEANVKDFQAKINQRPKTASRTIMIQAAVNETCPNTFLEFERPGVIDGAAPHWKRREIGKIKTSSNRPDISLNTELVRCMTFNDVIIDWQQQSRLRGMDHLSRRPHIVKIDTEGNDHNIIKSILLSPSNMRPLIIFYRVTFYKHAEIEVVNNMLERAGYSTNNRIYQENGKYIFSNMLAILRIIDY